MKKLQGESDRLRQVATAYRGRIWMALVVTGASAPAAFLRERLIHQIAKEAAQEAEQFELAAGAVALGSVPVTPPDSL